MVDRVARALVERGVEYDDQTLERMARAAIAAMREPTEAMIEAGQAEEWTGKREAVESVWGAMIDAALAD